MIKRSLTLTVGQLILLFVVEFASGVLFGLGVFGA